MSSQITPVMSGYLLHEDVKNIPLTTKSKVTFLISIVYASKM